MNGYIRLYKIYCERKFKYYVSAKIDRKYCRRYKKKQVCNFFWICFKRYVKMLLTHLNVVGCYEIILRLFEWKLQVFLLPLTHIRPILQSYRNQPLTCKTNQLTGYYMSVTSAWCGLKLILFKLQSH